MSEKRWWKITWKSVASVVAALTLVSASATAAVAASSADLQISVSGPSQLGWSSTGDYSWVVTNNGPDAADGATVSLSVSAGSLDSAQVSCVAHSGGVCPTFSQSGGSSLTATLATFPAGAVLNLTTTAKMPATGSSVDVSGHITAPDTVTDPNTGSNSTRVSTALTAKLEVTKTVSTTTPELGVPYTWTVVIKNSGPTDVGNVSIGDSYYGEGMATSWTAPTCRASGGAVCPAASAFTAGSSNSNGWLFIDVKVTSIPVDGSLTITYSMTNTDPTPHCGDNYSVSNQAYAAVNQSNFTSGSVYVTPPKQPDCQKLVVTKSASTDAPALGVPFTWTVVVTNPGPADLTNVKLSDLYHGAGLSTSWTAATCEASGGAVCPAASAFTAGSATENSWIFLDAVSPSMPAGGSLTITYSMTSSDLSPRCGETYSVNNEAFASTSDATSRSGQVSVTPPPQPACQRLEVTKSVSTTTPKLGVPYTWTIVVKNPGPADLADVKVSDSFYGYGMTTSWTAPTCSASDGAECPAASVFTAGTSTSNGWLFLDANAPMIPAGGSLTITYDMTNTDPSPTCGKTYSVSNEAMAATKDANFRSGSVYTAPPSPADLVTHATVSPGTGLSPGKAVTLGAKVYAGCGVGVDVPFAWTLPASTGFDVADPLAALSCTAPAGETCPTFSYDSATRTLKAVFAAVDSGVFELSIAGKVGVDGNSSHETTATLGDPDSDLVPSTNVSTVTYTLANTKVDGSVTFSLKPGSAVSPTDLTIDGTLHCTISGDFPWSVVLPAGLTSATSLVGSAWLDDTCTFTANGFPAAPAGMAWSTGLSGTGTSVDPVDGAFQAAYVAGLELRPVAHPAIAITKSINGNDANTAPGVEVKPDSTMKITMLVTNTGNVKLDPVVVTDDTIATDAISCPKSALDVGQAMTCTASYPAPKPGGQHTDTATVVATTPDGQTVTADDSANAWVKKTDAGHLAYTGVEGVAFSIAAGLMAVVTGVVLVGVRRRKNA